MRVNTQDWHAANQAYLSAAIQLLHAELGAYAQSLGVSATPPDAASAAANLNEARAALPAPAAIQTLIQSFGLSTFEEKVLLLCAGVELDSNLAALVAALQGRLAQPLPSFGLVLAAFPEAHWNAVSPSAPLRNWKLVNLAESAILTRAPLAIDEQILHYLTGIQVLDTRLALILDPVEARGHNVPSQERLIASIEAVFKSDARPLVIRLEGVETGKEAIAAGTADRLGYSLYRLAAGGLPTTRSELQDWIRIWDREAALNRLALFIDCERLDAADRAAQSALQQVVDRTDAPVFLSVGTWAPATNRRQIVFEVTRPTLDEQQLLWRTSLGARSATLNGHIDRITSQFNLGSGVIASIAADTTSGADLPGALRQELWDRCRRATRPEIDELAQRIKPNAGWDDLVLPAIQKAVLTEIASQVRHRKKVYHDWGFGKPGARGLGITVMFAGESGTGKTMAAEVLAQELGLDLYRIDLSQVVNKYIGETEKNLKRIFDAAENGGAILLFDEADALFGKRSEVKDSHDRYGNIEVSYLLQRMEAYRGLAILTTNLKSALDKAFLRRIRFVVQFPFPGNAQRSEIWRRVFPAGTPLASLDFEKLGRLSVTGGNIRNIALNAAFMAAEDSTSVSMPHIVRAARLEYQKLEKPTNSIEIES